MAMVPLNLPPGVARGATPNDVRGRWFDVNLVRWKGSVMEPIGGWARRTITPFPDRQIKLHSWTNNAGQRATVSASLSKVRVDIGEGFADRTPAGLVSTGASFDAFGYGTGDYGEEAFGTARSQPSKMIMGLPAFWTFDVWGEDLLGVSSVDGRLFYYDRSVPTGPFAPVASAPLSASVHVTPERHVMLLQTAGNPRRLAWSSREDHTDFNFASVTNTAGFLDLKTDSSLIKAVSVRGGELVLSGTDVFLARYIGVPYIYGVEWIGNSRIFAVDTLCVDNGMAFWWALDGFKMFDGNSIQTIPCPIWDYVSSRVSKAAGRSITHGSAHGTYPEIWWFYPSEGNTKCDSYVVYNYVEGWWSMGKLGRSAMQPSGATNFPLMAGEDGRIYEHDTGWAGDGALRDVYAETAAFSLDAGDNIVKIRRALLATGFGAGSVQAKIFGRNAPEGTETAYGPYAVRPGGYTDVRAQGRDLRVRLQALENTDWSVGEMRFDVALGGKR